MGLFVSLFIGIIAFATPALAYNPILNVYSSGNSTTISISGGQTNATVVISYMPSGSNLQTTVSGVTDYSGNFTTMVDAAVGSQISATVGGQQVYSGNNGYYNNNGCSYYGCNVGGLTLSQTSLSLSVGQSASVTVNYPVYGYSNNFYISSNSSSYVASASVSGSQINVYGLASGSTTISVCSNSGSSVCASLYVTVSGGSCSYYGCNVGGLTLSQTSLSLSVGQSASVTANYPVYNYSNSFYISSNSNSYVASASVSGSTINVYGLATGSTNISVCASGSVCATLYVTVGGSGYNNSGTITFSPSSVNLAAGQSSTVFVNAAYLGSSLYISSNSNSSVVSASISGSTMYLQAGSTGSSTITVCQNSSACGYLYVTVGGGGSGSLSLSQTSLSLSSGQSSTVSIYNNGSSYSSYYVSSNSNSNVASASISGSSLYVSALSSGSTSIVVCQSSYSSSCATLYVTVTGVLGANTNLWFSPGNPTLYVGQSLAVSINSSAYNTSNYYNNSAYYISSNSNSGVVSASISGTVLNLYANQTGSSNIAVCSSALSFCGTLYVTVGGGGSYYGGSLSLSQTSISLGQGQSMAVSAYNASAIYVSSNSNSNVVSVNVSGNQATIYGQSSGSSSIVLCGTSSSQCATVYVSVNGNSYSGNITLSQYSLGLNVGQSATVNVSGNGGYGYYVAQNSNPGVVSASFNGSVINIYAIANGSSTLQICQNSANSCPSLTVTVGGGYSYNSGYPYNYNNNGGGSGLQYPGGQSGVLGATAYANGQLISEGSTVYIVYKNTKTAFASAAAFLGLGFKFGNVLAVGNSGLASSGYTVTTQYAQHPWGSWVKSGSTVYFVHESGLIPVPDWNTFLNNGGQSSFIVNANTYDFRLSMLSPMTSGDSRLQ